MSPAEKDELLATARAEISAVQTKLQAATEEKITRAERTGKTTGALSAGDAIIERTLLAHHQEQLGNLKHLYPSPYFAFCNFETKGERKNMYFGKFSFREANIYSWITPAAALRFKTPGTASYTRPDGTEQVGHIHRKDQYLIVDGKILFFAIEDQAHPRELIYQEHFSRHKQGFVLPEVVEQMEQAQDQVVRAPYAGPLVITGPAGSGKTTLALHRVAYLMQAPETAEFFPPESVLVLVQDAGTKAYFSNLLPSLGIVGVTIQTFDEWALAALELSGYHALSRSRENGPAELAYDFAKLTAVRSAPALTWEKKDPFKLLEKIYQPQFTPAQQTAWQKQISTRTLDRFDVALLLRAKRNVGEFTFEKNYYEELKNGRYQKKSGRFPVRYNLMIIDEFQNYLPEQIAILKTTLNKRTESVVYVGDLAQQTRLGTVRDWESIGEKIPVERLVKLQKVYRNTKQILKYIQTLGYSVIIPEGIKEGAPVDVHPASTNQEELAILESLTPTDTNQTLGILYPSDDYFVSQKSFFAEKTNVRCLTFYEAQGVEFDTVAIVGMHDAFFSTDEVPEGAQEEVQRMRRDLYYVALTRAMEKLVIIKKTP